jgi:hypothetical protein
MELTPYAAYGFRLYRNDNELYVHVDRPETHVISFILHIDSSEDAEPWPILIEDYDGSKSFSCCLLHSRTNFSSLIQYSRNARGHFDKWRYSLVRVV